MTDARTEAELAHVAMVAADAIAWLRQNELRRLAASQGPRVVRRPARYTPAQLEAAYARERLRNPRTGRPAPEGTPTPDYRADATQARSQAKETAPP